MHDACELRLRVKGVDYGDILTATWSRGFEQAVDTASLVVSEKWMQPLKVEAFPFRKLTPCEFVVDGTVVITGYVKSIPRGYGTNGPRDFRVEVVSKSWVAVTSSYAGARRTWRDATLMRIASDLLTDYEIEVTTELTDIHEPFNRFGVAVGETVWSALQRALRDRGVWCVSKRDGNVEIVEASRRRYATPFIGPGVPDAEQNVSGANYEDSAEDMFSDIIVVGQSGKKGDWFGSQAAHGWALAHDPSVDVFRTLVLSEPSVSKQRELEYRAEWEIRTRAGRARRISYQTQGAYWDNALFEYNRRVAVQDPGLDTYGEFLISHILTSFGSGTVSTIDVAPPQAFLRESLPPSLRSQPRNKSGEFVAW